MKIALFLGAGASMPFDKPATTEFKGRLYNKVNTDSILYWFLNHYDYSDVEQLLQAIRDSKNFADGYGGKFLTNSQSRLFVRDRSKEITFMEFVNELRKLEEMIYEEVFHAYRWNFKDDNNLRTIFSEIILFLKEFSEKIMVFTTNYDRAVEEYCGRINEKFYCVDGFSLDKRTKRFFWDSGRYEPSNEKDVTDVYLYKLHGSLNWKEHEGTGIVRIERTSEESRSSDTNYTDNILIFPTLYSKERSQLEPFRTIRQIFEEYVKGADVCIVVGFSFRDDHLKETFRDFIRDGKKLIIISPNAKLNYHENLLTDVIQKSDGRTRSIKRVFWTSVGSKNEKSIKSSTYEPNNVYFVEKSLTPENVKEIIHDVKRIIEQEKHPF